MKYSIKSCATVFMLLLISGTTIVSSDITSSTGKLHDHYDSSAYHSTLFRDKTISLNYGGSYDVTTQASNRFKGTCVQNYATGLYTQQKCVSTAAASVTKTDRMDGNYFKTHYHKSWSN